MKNIIRKIISFTVALSVLAGIQSFINPNPEPIPLAQSSIVYITDCPNAYAMYMNIVGTDDAPPYGMTMEDDLMEFSISGTETFISDQDIKYYCDSPIYPTAYVWIKFQSTSSWNYVGFINPYMLDVTEVIDGARLTSMTVSYDDIHQPTIPL